MAAIIFDIFVLAIILPLLYFAIGWYSHYAELPATLPDCHLFHYAISCCAITPHWFGYWLPFFRRHFHWCRWYAADIFITFSPYFRLRRRYFDMFTPAIFYWRHAFAITPLLTLLIFSLLSHCCRYEFSSSIFRHSLRLRCFAAMPAAATPPCLPRLLIFDASADAPFFDVFAACHFARWRHAIYLPLFIALLRHCWWAFRHYALMIYISSAITLSLIFIDAATRYRHYHYIIDIRWLFAAISAITPPWRHIMLQPLPLIYITPDYYHYIRHWCHCRDTDIH